MPTIAHGTGEGFLGESQHLERVGIRTNQTNGKLPPGLLQADAEFGFVRKIDGKTDDFLGGFIHVGNPWSHRFGKKTKETAGLRRLGGLARGAPGTTGREVGVF